MRERGDKEKLKRRKTPGALASRLGPSGDVPYFILASL